MPNLKYTASVDINVDNFGGRTNWDTLQIINGATVTVDTDQTGSWTFIDIQNGKLLIRNTSSLKRLRFMMGRGVGATANYITPASGLGIIEVTGSWIELGKGDGLPNDTFTTPYTDFIPAVWVEDSSGSNTYTPWMNLTSQVGENIQYFRKDMEFAYSGSTGNFFYQQTIPEPYPWNFTGSISGSGLPVRAGVSLLYSSSIYFGDGINGNVIPSESRVRIPNIMITDTTPLNLLTATSATQANFSLTLGGVFTANCALFDESYCNFSQAQTCELKNCAFAEYPLITECYSLLIDNVALSSHPPRRYFTSGGGWITRDLRWGTQCTWNYISNANINNLYICNHSPNALYSNQNTATAATTANSPFFLSYTNNITVNNLKVYMPFKSKNFQYGIITNYVNDSNFSNIEIYGGEYINLINSNNNIFNSITASTSFLNAPASFTSSWRIGVDPNTNEPLVLGEKYYIKTRAYRNFQNPWQNVPSNIFFYQTGSEFVDSIEYSFTPYTASKSAPSESYRNHPDYFGAYPVLNTTNYTQPTASLIWVQRAPSVGYELYRGTSSGFTERSPYTMVYSSSTVATVTFNDTGSVSKPMNFGSPYYYVLRKYDGPISGSAYGYSESAEQEVIPRQFPSGSNVLRDSAGFVAGTWTKTGITITGDQKLGPNDVPIATSATNTSDLLFFNSTTGTCIQTASVVNNGLYNFSVYLSALTSSVSMSISASCGTTNVSQSYVLDQRWIRASIPFVATSNTASVGIFGNGVTPIGTKAYAFGAQLETGSVAGPYVATVGATVTQRPISHEINSLRVWSRGAGGSGVEVYFNTPPVGTLHWELHMATASNFTPTQRTLVGQSIVAGGGNPINLNNASNNIIKNVKQVFKGSGYPTTAGIISLTNASSTNRFLNFDLDYNYVGGTNMFVINTLANNNFVHNWRVNNWRNYIAANYLVTALNNAQGFTVQNFYCNNSDIALYNINLDVALKNVSAANGRPATNATTYTLAGSTTDQNSLTAGQVYDTIFNEWIWNPPSGSMNLNFNASVKNPSPYKITGSLYFSNTARLYFNSTGSIEYEWPWRIYGISSFRPEHVLDAGSASVDLTGNAWLPAVICNTIDLGDDNLTGYSLKKEIAFKTGSVYGPYTEIDKYNAGYVSNSFDPYVGFNMKVKITSRPALKFDGQGTTATSSFIIGEYVTGSQSGAKAKIIAQEDKGTTGTLILEAITGSFRDNEILAQSGEVNKGLANGSGSVPYLPNNILIPQPTSYIASMQWFTIVNTASLYPVSSPTLTVTGMKSGSKIDVIKVSDSSIMDAQYINTDSAPYTFTYDYFNDTPVYLIVQNLGYVYQRIETTLTEGNLSIPVQQTIDRNYKNLPGP
jgi:hypothetical protein